MTPEEIWKWQQDMFIYSCYLYYELDDPILSDQVFDAHCKMLLEHYEDCTPDFKARVSREDLRTGSGFALNYTEDEIAGALKWKNRVRPPKEDQ